MLVYVSALFTLNGARKIAKKMKLKNETIEEIMEFTELSREEIEKL